MDEKPETHLEAAERSRGQQPLHVVEPILSEDDAKARLADAKYPRVTEQDIRARIKAVHYVVHGLTTVCLLTVDNGFRVIGHSTPASAGNFDAQIGERYAYDHAFRQLWPLYGFLLRQKICEQNSDGADYGISW